MSRNFNHPVKGSRIPVEPIRDPKDIETNKRLLRNRPRDLLIFIMGFKDGLRAGDLLKLKAWQLSRIIHGVRFRFRLESRGEAEFWFCEPRLTTPSAKDAAASGEENHRFFLSPSHYTLS